MPERPLRWQIPGESAALLGWRIGLGDQFEAGQALGRVRLSDGAIWELRATRPGRVLGLHAQPGVTVCTGDWLVTAEDLAPTMVAQPIEKVTVTHDKDINCVAFSPDGRWFATGSDDNTVRIWETSTGREVRRISHDNWVLSVAFSPYGDTLATGGRDKTARIWERSSGRQLASFGCGGRVLGLGFSPLGAGLATAAVDVRVWSISEGTYDVLGEDSANDVSISPDGTCIVSADRDGVTRVRRWPSAELITEIGHDAAAYCVAFSADSTRIVSGGEDGQVGVWDALTGEPIFSVKHGDDEVHGVAFSPDCTYFATGGDDTWARVWDAATGQELASVEHDNYVRGVAIGPDDTLLATASWDDTARISRIHY